MGTKEKPGEFNCYAKALPDEPLFILLARDPIAPSVVEHWADRRARQIKHGTAEKDDLIKVKEADMIAQDMRDWRATANEKWKAPQAIPPFLPVSGDALTGDAVTADQFATNILTDILVGIFANDSTVAHHLMSYRLTLTLALQRWADRPKLDKDGLSSAVKRVLAAPIPLPPSAPPVMKPVIEEPKFIEGQDRKLVWIRGPHDPVAQIWYSEKQFNDQREIVPLQQHRLTDDDFILSLADLMVKYPFNPKDLPAK